MNSECFISILPSPKQSISKPESLVRTERSSKMQQCLLRLPPKHILSELTLHQRFCRWTLGMIPRINCRIDWSCLGSIGSRECCIRYCHWQSLFFCTRMVALTSIYRINWSSQVQSVAGFVLEHAMTMNGRVNIRQVAMPSLVRPLSQFCGHIQKNSHPNK
jgi:hypothetical protein